MYHLFCPKKIFLTFVFYLKSMYKVLNTISQCTYFYKSKNITSYTFVACFWNRRKPSVKAFIESLHSSNLTNFQSPAADSGWLLNFNTLARVKIFANRTKSFYLPWKIDVKFHFWLAIKLKLSRRLFLLNLKILMGSSKTVKWTLWQLR